MMYLNAYTKTACQSAKEKAACASSVKPMGLRYFGVVLSLRDGVVGI